MQLQDQVAIITGGANGIGRATSLRFAEEGANIVVADVQAERGAETVASVQALGRQAIYVHVDASNKVDNEAMVDAALSKFGQVNVLLAAAGISHSNYNSGDLETDLKYAARRLDYIDQPALMFCDIELEEWRRVIEVNLTGTFLAMQACARPMIESGNGGRIITIASIAAKNPDAGPTAYTASKAGVWMLTKKAARELAPANIRVNSIGPGFIDTNMTAMLDEIDEAKEELMKSIPMGHKGQPRDIANAALFLASDQSSYMTGTILHPDGGFFTD